MFHEILNQSTLITTVLATLSKIITLRINSSNKVSLFVNGTPNFYSKMFGSHVYMHGESTIRRKL